MAKQTSRQASRIQSPDAFGFWNRPVLMNLVADLLIVFAVATLVWAAAVAFQRLPVFPLREVIVVSEPDQVTRAQLEQAARTAIAGNFFTVDLDGVRNTFEKLPWVRRADVRRRWPDSLELAFEEHAAVARWRRGDGGSGQESRLVNKYGEVFAAASTVALPAFVGPEGTAPLLLARYQEFEQVLAPLGRHPETLVLSRREAWQVKLDDGLVLELGRDEAKHPLLARLERFVGNYRAAIEKTHLAGLGVVDMRYPNGFALRVAKKS